MVSLCSILVNEGWESLTGVGVSIGLLGICPLLWRQSLVLVLDAFMLEKIADGLSLALDVEVDESWHTVFFDLILIFNTNL